LEHRYGTTKAQLPKKIVEAESSINKRLIPPKEIIVGPKAPLRGLE
jgi:hypothetical protein